MNGKIVGSTMNPSQRKASKKLQRKVKPGVKSTAQRLLQMQKAAGNRAVVQMMHAGPAQLKDEYCPGCPDTAQMEMMDEEELGAQTKMAAQREALDEEELPAQSKTSGGMPPGLQTKMENTFQADFSDVTVHSNSSKAPSVGALAYTQGTDIHFAPGQFNPGTGTGRQLLGHELAHVEQQRQGRVQPTGEINGLPVNDNPGLENEADKMGRRAGN